jgi:hypothetical protein
MVEIHPSLFIRSQHDYEVAVRWEAGWSVVQAAVEPYHCRALGCTGRSAPEDHPEFLVAPRGDVLILNLLDTVNPAQIPGK